MFRKPRGKQRKGSEEHESLKCHAKGSYSGAITGEEQPNIHFRKIWKLCRGWIREGTPKKRKAVEGYSKGVAWTKAERKERGCEFKRGYGRDRWADMATAQTGTRAEDLPGILKAGRVDRGH